MAGVGIVSALVLFSGGELVSFQSLKASLK
jgi:hypothetical protein